MNLFFTFPTSLKTCGSSSGPVGFYNADRQVIKCFKVIKSHNMAVLLISLFLASCVDPGNFDNIEEPMLMVATFSPDINANSVTFSGRVTAHIDQDIKGLDGNFNYGFMWYISDEEQEQFTEPILIPVGTSNTSLDFELDIATLPKDLSLVVCAFAQAVPSGQGALGPQMSVGEELSFEVPR